MHTFREQQAKQAQLDGLLKQLNVGGGGAGGGPQVMPETRRDVASADDGEGRQDP